MIRVQKFVFPTHELSSVEVMPRKDDELSDPGQDVSEQLSAIGECLEMDGEPDMSLCRPLSELVGLPAKVMF